MWKPFPNPFSKPSGRAARDRSGATRCCVWMHFWGAFLRSGWPRGPGRALKNVGAFPGPRGRPDLKKRTPLKSGQTAARTQNSDLCMAGLEPVWKSGPAHFRSPPAGHKTASGPEVGLPVRARILEWGLGGIKAGATDMRP
jgi:hypothetical protein